MNVTEFSSSNILLNCLLSAYPENGWTLYKTKDYWTCKELIDIAAESRIPAEVKLQLQENDKFNIYLNSRADKKLDWLYLKGKKSVKAIKKLRKTYE